MIQLRYVQRFIAGFAFVTLPVLCASAPALAYDRATVVNNTDVAITGTIHYAACHPDQFTIAAGLRGKNDVITPTQTTMRASRGLCLITRVEATAGGAPVVPYTSGGTIRARFVLNRTVKGFQVFPG